MLDEATSAIQAGGVSGFSYADLADRVGVKAPSLHHHFPRKDGLVAATAARYRQAFRAKAEAIEADDPVARLGHYCELFLEPAIDDVLCLCAAAVAGWGDLNDEARREVGAFFADETRWIEGQLRQARDEGGIRADVDPADLATSLIAALEGSLLLARTGGDTAPARTVANTLLRLAAA
ncbi:MAG: TetR family transcriptional regulator [Actinomycetota bacterium]